MKLNFDHLLYQLALDYNTKIINNFHSTPTNSFSSYRKRKRIEEQQRQYNNELLLIEDEILYILHLKQLNESEQRISKRPKHYNMTKIYFTHPETGLRNVFTYEYTYWYQNYVLNPKPDSTKWSKKFRNRFRVPYNLYLDLVKKCNDCIIFAQWSSHKKF